MKKAKFILLSLVTVLCLTSCDLNESFGSIEDKLWPNIWITLAQLASFLVMAILVMLFVYKPLKKKMDARKQHVIDTVKNAENKLQDANNTQKQADKNIADSKQKANEIIESAREAATKESEIIMSEANEKIEQKMNQAAIDLENEKKAMQKEIHNTIIENSLDASKEILGRELNEKDNDKLVDGFLSKIKENK